MLLVVFFTEVLPLNSPAPGSLPALLATLSDPRGRQGLRHPLAAMLAATVCGILTGARGCEAIAQWVRNQDPKIWHLLGFRRKPPCANTYRTLLARLPAEMFEEMIQRWIEPLLPPPSSNSLQALAMDGKTLRGTSGALDRAVHLLSLLDQQTGGVLRQLKMPPDTNEHKAALTLLKAVALKGRGVALCPRLSRPRVLLAACQRKNRQLRWQLRESDSVSSGDVRRRSQGVAGTISIDHSAVSDGLDRGRRDRR